MSCTTANCTCAEFVPNQWKKQTCSNCLHGVESHAPVSSAPSAPGADGAPATRARGSTVKRESSSSSASSPPPPPPEHAAPRLSTASDAPEIPPRPRRGTLKSGRKPPPAPRSYYQRVVGRHASRSEALDRPRTSTSDVSQGVAQAVAAAHAAREAAAAAAAANPSAAADPGYEVYDATEDPVDSAYGGAGRQSFLSFTDVNDVSGGGAAVPAAAHNLMSDIESVSELMQSERQPSVRPLFRSFGSKLPHKFDMVQEQVKSGLYTLKRVRGFFKKYVQLQHEFTQALYGILEEEQRKLEAERSKRVNEPDRMATCYTTWKSVLDGVSKMARQHREYTDSMRTTIYEPLDAFHKIGSEAVAMAMREVKSFEKLGKTRRQLEKRRARCEGLLDDLINKQTTGTSSSASTAAQSKHHAAIEQMKAKALKECEQYDSLSRHHNQAREQYYTADIPRILDGLQDIEEVRLAQLQKQMQLFVTKQAAFSRTIASISGEIEEVVNDFDPVRDVEYFIEHCNNVHGNPPQWRPYSYDLSVPLSGLRPREFTAPDVVFATTIEAIMEHQEKSNPNANEYGIPRILDRLGSKLYDMGGLEAEGIFRVSPDHNAVQRLREQVICGDYSLSGVDSVHTVASLLKYWLRDLEEPLVPFDMYDECIEMGKHSWDGEPRVAAGGVSSGSFAELQGRVQSLLNRLPQYNRRVLAYLVTIIRDIAANEALNRMTIQALAVVFAPSFLRDESGDPMVMMQDSKHAAQFVVHLAAATDVDLRGEPTGRRVSVSGVPLISRGDAMSQQQQQVEQAPEPQASPSAAAADQSYDPRGEVEYQDYDYPAPPEGWELLYDPASGDSYYYQPSTGLSQWTCPEY